VNLIPSITGSRLNPKIQPRGVKNTVFTLFTLMMIVIRLVVRNEDAHFLGRLSRKKTGVCNIVTFCIRDFGNSLLDFVKLLAKDPLKVLFAKALPP